jgi:hypothetical protein
MRSLLRKVTGFVSLMSVALSLAVALPARPAQAVDWWVPDGPVWIQNDNTRLCVDAPNGGPSYPDEPITQYPCRHNDNQRFHFTSTGQVDPYGRPTYKIIQAVGLPDLWMCIDLPGYTWVPPGTDVSIYPCRGNDNQDWLLLPMNEWTVQIVNVASGLCLDVPGYRDPFAVGRADLRLKVFTCARVYEQDDHDWELRSNV